MRTKLLPALLAVVTLASAACRSIPGRTASQDRCATDPVRLCTTDGIIYVQAVDDRRILIAIDAQGAQKPDGLVDDLFLYTAREPHGFSSRTGPFAGHVEYSQGVLRVVGKDGSEPLLFLVRPAALESKIRINNGTERRFEHSIGLSHYTGLQPLRLERLKALHASAQCDGPVGSCVEVDGFRIGFPA
jgi:hypothetical protein